MYAVLNKLPDLWKTIMMYDIRAYDMLITIFIRCKAPTCTKHTCV